MAEALGPKPTLKAVRIPAAQQPAPARAPDPEQVDPNELWEENWLALPTRWDTLVQQHVRNAQSPIQYAMGIWRHPTHHRAGVPRSRYRFYAQQVVGRQYQYVMTAEWQRGAGLVLIEWSPAYGRAVAERIAQQQQQQQQAAASTTTSTDTWVPAYRAVTSASTSHWVIPSGVYSVGVSDELYREPAPTPTPEPPPPVEELFRGYSGGDDDLGF